MPLRNGADPDFNVGETRAIGRCARFSDNYAREIIVSKRLLREECEAPENAQSVSIDYKGEPVPLRIVATADLLPDGYRFISSDGLVQQIMNDALVTNPDAGNA